MNQTPLNLAAARYRAANDRPYLASAIMAMLPIESKGLGTLATDEWWRLYYDPEILDEWKVEEIASVIIHEVGHLIRDHMNRFKRMGVKSFFSSNLANLAGDAEINDDLKAEGLKLPGDPMMPAKINMADGLLAEEYFAALQKENPEPNDGSSGMQSSSGSGQGKSSGNSKGGGSGKSPNSSSKQKGSGSGAQGQLPEDFDRNGPGHGKCGSCASGIKQPWELPGPEECGEHGIGQMQGELIRRDVARRILESSNTRGTIPAGWKRWAELKMKPKVDWRKQLGAVVRMTLADAMGAVDYTRSRPSRRQSVSPKVVLPALRKPTPNVCVAIDTSGSMGDDRLSAALAETNSVLKQCGLRDGVTVFAVDAQVHTAKKVFNIKQVDLLGGGGTDMSVGIEQGLRLRPRPDAIIVLTDGYTPWPKDPPPVKVIVVLIGGEKNGPPWAKNIVIDHLESRDFSSIQ